MRPRYTFLSIVLLSLTLATVSFAQNREVTGTTDADGVYAQKPGTINGKTFYSEINNSGLSIYYCDETDFFDNGGFSCTTGNPSTGFWFIGSQPYAGSSTPSNTILYYSEQPKANASAPLGSYDPFNGASVNANVTNTALPVELTSFDRVVSGQAVSLVWTTASETNNAGFAVEMKQGEAFVEQGFVAGHGTTLEAQRYTFDAGTLAPGTYTFRLRQVDFDGAFEYSDELEVAVALEQPLLLSTPHPNPMRDRSQIEVSVQQTQPVAVRLFDLLGREVGTLFDGTLQAHETRVLTLERGTLPAGLYLVQLQGTQVQSTRQVTLL